MGERPSHWTPKTTGAGFEFSPILKPLETFRDSRHRGLEPRSAAGRARTRSAPAPGSPARAPKRTEAEDFIAGTSLDQIIARQIAKRHGVPVARDRHRGSERLRRRLRRRLQLRLHEHHLVEGADDAAADGDQPARGVRAAVRPAGLARATGWRACGRTAASSTRCAATSRRSSSGLGARDRVRLDRVSRARARDRRAASSAPSSRRRPTSDDRRRRRSAFPTRGKSTPR